MPLSNTQLRYYDSNILRLPADKRKEYHAQVDRLIENLCRNVRDKTKIKITKVVKAGSFAKFTILRKTADSPVDVDVVFYISGKEASAETLDDLSTLIYDLLIEQYPNKSVEDFQIQRKAATVTFVGSGLSVDIVPVIEDANRPGYGWQYDIHDGSKVQTCAPCQIKFVRDRKNVDGDFRTLVRLAKKWRNYAEVKPLKSFAIELIMAYLLDTRSKDGSIEQRFRDFLLYIAQSGLKEVITFPENVGPIPTFRHPVVIIDPVSNANNVASRISEVERKEIVAAANDAWEAANFASAEDDHAVWKELFGSQFKTEEG
ncbi:CBASS oligonucleotide cyclase [Sphingomonas sp. CFBP 13706]|uniref:CBASS oligonucleotide cyclase n=1 Tax=Sphingomonas sp. CFBP 13706 TaxID=2775314 RepID=UPI00177CC514|nr:CBASS oligonucleotide cyclase [Sphingomonas sp. CFBP 13706]MBD8736862.1 nucleotidyltransferase [Sphingomonas sp. CFBP 13706]